MKHILYVVAESRYFKTHRLALAMYVLAQGYQVSLATTSTHATLTQDMQYFESLGIHVYPIPIQRTSLNPWHDLQTFLALMRVIRRCKPDIVHNVALKPVLYGTWAAKIMRVCTRHTIHCVNAISGLGYVFTSTSRRAQWIQFVLRPILSWTLKNTSVIVQNAVDAQSIADLGQSSYRIHILKGAGVDTLAFAPSSNVCSPEPFIFTCVARMLWSKGIGELLVVARRLKKHYPHAVIQCVGEPDVCNPDHVPQSILQQAHDEGVINFLGQRDDIAHVYQNSHVAILPSYREGLPKSLIEACSCALPLITTTAPGCADMVINPRDHLERTMMRGDNGYLVPACDVDALYTACVQIMNMTEDDRRQMGQASRNYALNVLDQHHIHDQTRCVYEEVFMNPSS